MNNEKRVSTIIEALAKHEDNTAVEVLEEIGTNSSIDEVRRLTARALIKRNTPDALAVVISRAGKGINDLSTNVAMSSINELLALKDKSNAMDVLNKVDEADWDENVKETARSVKALMAFS